MIVNLGEGAIESSGVIFIGQHDGCRLRRKPWLLFIERGGKQGGMYEFEYASKGRRDLMYDRIVEAACRDNATEAK